MLCAVLLAVICVGCVVAAIELAGADWPWRSPGTAILLWQGIGLAWGVAAIGTLIGIGLAPYGHGAIRGLYDLGMDVAAGQVPAEIGWLALGAVAAGLLLAGALLVMLLVSTAAVVRARRRHRELLTLVGHGDPKVPGALVLDHPAAAAYCVPGVRSRVVISAGALRLLDRTEVNAVMKHEKAHVRWRHDLVLLPFCALRRLFPTSRVVANALGSVALLIEMTADDCARETPRALATALLRIGATGANITPAGALGAAQTMVSARVNRLLRPAPALTARGQAIAVVAAITLMAVPVVLVCLPL